MTRTSIPYDAMGDHPPMSLHADLSDALELLSKATPGRWHTKTECPGLCCWHLFQPDTAAYSDDVESAETSSEIIDFTEMSEENARAIVAAVNLLRTHGTALLEAAGREKELRDALGRAWSALVVGGDCASMLADLQESGVYRPRCSDGKPSKADARRDYRQIADAAKAIHPLAFPRHAAPSEASA